METKNEYKLTGFGDPFKQYPPNEKHIIGHFQPSLPGEPMAYKQNKKTMEFQLDCLCEVLLKCINAHVPLPDSLVKEYNRLIKELNQ